jgi:hypothetical protein
MYIIVYIKKFMSMKPNPKEINIILNILKGAQFEFLPQAPFYIDLAARQRLGTHVPVKTTIGALFSVDLARTRC